MNFANRVFPESIMSVQTERTSLFQNSRIRNKKIAKRLQVSGIISMAFATTIIFGGSLTGMLTNHQYTDVTNLISTISWIFGGSYLTLGTTSLVIGIILDK